MNYIQTSVVQTEPLTLEQARDHLRVTPYGSPLEHPDDTYISALITSAREFCEEYTRRALATKTVEVVFDSWSDNKLVLPFAPLQSVTSVQYVDVTGVTQTLATTVYGVDRFRRQIYLKAGQTWPPLYSDPNPIIVTAEVGYTNGQSPDIYPMPETIMSAMKLIIGNLYENRQQDLLGSTRISFNSLPLGVYNLLQPYRLGMGC